MELQNEKLTLPSFSLRVEGAEPKKDVPTTALLETPVYFPYLPRHETVSQSVPLLFPKRGVYRQEAFRIVTRFPFGFLAEGSATRPSDGSPGLSFGRSFGGISGCSPGNSRRDGELYRRAAVKISMRLRDYLPNDSARLVHWKASARSGSLMVREFAREDDCNVLLVFDLHCDASRASASRAKKTASSAQSLFVRPLPGASTSAARFSSSAVPRRRFHWLPHLKTFFPFFTILPWRSR